MLTRNEESALGLSLEDIRRSFMEAVKAKDYTYSFSPDVRQLKDLLSDVLRRKRKTEGR